MKNYIGFSRDHSASMRGITSAAMLDYNETIKSVKFEAEKHGIDTIVSVVKCGDYPCKVTREVSNSSVQTLKPLTSYEAEGTGTPLFDSIGDLIELFEKVPDYNDPTVSFVVMAITDGEENRSVKWNQSSISAKMKSLQASDKWTFVFRVPKGGKRTLISMGIPEHNILEWEQTSKGVQESTAFTQSAFRGFYESRALGATSTNKFYADLSGVKIKDVKKNLVDISGDVEILLVSLSSDGMQIREFVEIQTGKPLVKGSAFYQLTKTEIVQDYKQIIIKDKLKGSIYGGVEARNMLGLPDTGQIKLAPGNTGQYDVFVQSTSVNRKLIGGTYLMISEQHAV